MGMVCRGLASSSAEHPQLASRSVTSVPIASPASWAHWLQSPPSGVAYNGVRTEDRARGTPRARPLVVWIKATEASVMWIGVPGVTRRSGLPVERLGRARPGKLLVSGLCRPLRSGQR